MFLNSRSFFKSVLQPLFAVLFSLLVLPWANAVSYPTVTAMPVGIPDAGNVDIAFTVSGQSAPITSITVAVNLNHAWGGDIRLQLIAPNGTALDLVSGIGGSGGSNTDFAGLYTFVDPATPGALIFSQATGAGGTFTPGSYATSTAGGAPTSLLATFAALTTPQINGTWILKAYDTDSIITGTVNSVTLNIVGTGTNAVCGTPPASIIAPSGAALCSSGTGTAVTSGVNTFTWGCNSTDGGTNTAANACSSIRQYTVTATPTSGASGTISCTSPVNGGSTTTCTSTPGVGFRTASISGCSGTATAAGVNSYTTGAVTADCTVTATYEAVTNGACATPPASIVAPSGAALCSAGTGTAVTSGVNTYTWGCNGANGGTNTAANACSSIRQYTVTATPAAGATGSISCTTPVNGGGTTSCTASPAMGYITGSISGCGGAATGSGVNAYTTAAVVADCTVTATFLQIVNGTCGAANSVAVHDAPSAGLCGTGTASVVATAAGQFTWTCNGANTGTNASCAAPRTYLLTASVSGGNGTATAAAGGVVAYNATGTVTITPNAGYSTITPLGGTCTGALAGTTFTSNPMTADCSVIASFLQIPIVPTTAVSPLSGGSVSCVGPAVFGGTSTCTATPAAGYLFTGFSGCGGTPTSSLTYVTGAITGACLVTASFTSVSIPTLSPMFLAVLAVLALLVGGFSLRKRVL